MDTVVEVEAAVTAVEVVVVLVVPVAVVAPLIGIAKLARCMFSLPHPPVSTLCLIY